MVKLIPFLLKKKSLNLREVNRMPEFKEHCEISKDLFGEDGEEYHKWIDQYAKYGYRHRQVLHNREGIEVGVQLFGEKARKHLKQHLKDDGYEKILTIRQVRKNKRATDGLKEHKPKYKILKVKY